MSDIDNNDEQMSDKSGITKCQVCEERHRGPCPRNDVNQVDKCPTCGKVTQVIQTGRAGPGGLELGSYVDKCDCPKEDCADSLESQARTLMEAADKAHKVHLEYWNSSMELMEQANRLAIRAKKKRMEEMS